MQHYLQQGAWWAAGPGEVLPLWGLPTLCAYHYLNRIMCFHLVQDYFLRLNYKPFKHYLSIIITKTRIAYNIKMKYLIKILFPYLQNWNLLQPPMSIPNVFLDVKAGLVSNYIYYIRLYNLMFSGCSPTHDVFRVYEQTKSRAIFQNPFGKNRF